MNENINLSYLVVTKNKLPYLKITLNKLISQKKEDEEIIVGDGASTDGTKEYLDSLKKDGLIDGYTSESDFGVAHALNKLILSSKGALIKIITDDDIFHYPTITICKNFMLQHSEVDVLNTNGGVLSVNSGFKLLNYDDAYRKFQKDHKPFSFCELGIIFRRSSLPVIGLRDPSFKRADMEMSMRITSGKAKIAWYSAYSYVNVINQQSVSLVNMKEMGLETDRLNKFYLNKNPDHFFIKKVKIILNKIKMLSSKNKLQTSGLEWTELVGLSEKWLEEKNLELKPEFIN